MSIAIVAAMRLMTLPLSRTIEYSTEEGATAACREFLAEHPKLAGFTLWAGLRKVIEEQRQGTPSV